MTYPGYRSNQTITKESEGEYGLFLNCWDPHSGHASLVLILMIVRASPPLSVCEASPSYHGSVAEHYLYNTTSQGFSGVWGRMGQQTGFQRWSAPLKRPYITHESD